MAKNVALEALISRTGMLNKEFAKASQMSISGLNKYLAGKCTKHPRVREVGNMALAAGVDYETMRAAVVSCNAPRVADTPATSRQGRRWLRLRLAELQMSVGDFAHASGRNRLTAGRWISGETCPGLEDQITIACVLHMDAESVIERFASKESHEDDMNRRDFLVGTTGLLLCPTAPSTTPDSDQRIAELVQLRRALVGSDAVLGARPVMDAVVGHVKDIEAELHSYPSTVRHRLFEVGAMFCELAGWLADDLGMVDAGMYWSDRALSWAHAARSAPAVAYVLQRKAQQAIMMNDAPTAIALATSLPTQGVPIKVQAAAEQQLAHGLAAEGDDLGALNALDRAAAHLSRTDSEPPPPFTLASWCTPAYLSVQRAACLTKLGRPADAVEAFDSALARWPGAYRRERGLHLARKSYAMLLSGDPEGAAHVGMESARILAAVHSERTRAELRKVERGLRKIDSRDAGVLAFRNEVAPRLLANEARA